MTIAQSEHAAPGGLPNLVPVERRRAAIAAQAAQQAAQAADQAAQLESHWARAIAAWCSQTTHEDRPLVIPHLDSLTKAAVDGWIVSLTAAGYRADVDGARLIISM
jgi:hypothetical protein